MLTEYIHKAMGQAVYEKLQDGTYCGEIPEWPRYDCLWTDAASVSSGAAICVGGLDLGEDPPR